jgi:uncharacterized protein (TIGR04255 family)
MTNYPKLSDTPIKETIFTISYSETIDTDILKLFSQKKEIAERYDSIRHGFSTQLVVAPEGQKPLADISTDGYILKCSKDDKLIEARKGAFSFHKVNKYEKFDVLLLELISLWELLVSCYGQKLSVNNISLRYLNFIDYRDEKISELIKIVPTNPFTDELSQSFVHLNFRDMKYDKVDINVLASYPVYRDSNKCVVLDTILNQKQNNITDYESIKNDFVIMREVKNYVFFTTVTEYTLNKYK